MLSHRAGAILLVILAIAAYHIWTSGKLGRAWAALNGSSSSSGSSGGSAGGSLGGAGGLNGGSQFGLSGVTASKPAPAGYLGLDQSWWSQLGLSAAGEWNYLLPAGSQQAISLPNGGQGWSLITQGTQSGLGGYEIWQNINGAVLGFLHLSGLWNPSSGTGGTVGVTGWPTSPEFGNGTAGPSNAHLAVIYNQAGQQYVG